MFCGNDKKAYLCTRKTETVPWMSGLVNGLQNRLRRFESARHLSDSRESVIVLKVSCAFFFFNFLIRLKLDNMRTSILKSFALMAVVALTACSDDDDSRSIADFIHTPNAPAASKIYTVERSGYFKDAYDWNFKYDGNNLDEAYAKYTGGVLSQDASRFFEYELKYGANNVKVKTSGEDVALNVTSEGLLTKAKSGNTTFEYHYADGCLIAWKSTFHNTGFNGSVTKGESAVLKWENGNITKITYVPNTDAEHKIYTYDITYYDEYLNNNGVMLEVDSKVMGCKGAEFFYYAGLLGKATKNLVSKVVVTYSVDETENVTYLYYHQHRQGDLYLTNYKKVVADGMDDEPVVVEYNKK